LLEEIIKAAEGSVVRFNEPMKLHTSFKTGGPADIYISPCSIESLAGILKAVKKEGCACTVLGNGSNTLVLDGGIEGVVIQIGDGLSKITSDGEYITAQSGALLSAIAAYALENSLQGFEFASGIPGSFGGAVFMNAGAYGPEIKDVLVSVRVLNENFEIKTVFTDALELGYRKSILQKNGWTVLDGILKLKTGDKNAIFTKMSELSQKRRDKQPLQFPSAGSTFKRPEGFFAGKLIEDCGLKGAHIGAAEVSEKHAGFIINKGNASSKDILDLIAFCQKNVREKFKVELVPEVRIIGRE